MYLKFLNRRFTFNAPCLKSYCWTCTENTKHQVANCKSFKMGDAFQEAVASPRIVHGLRRCARCCGLWAKLPLEHLWQRGSNLLTDGGTGLDGGIAALATLENTLSSGLGEDELELITSLEEVKSHGANVGRKRKLGRETSLHLGCVGEASLRSRQRVEDRVVVVLRGSAVDDTGELVRSTSSCFGTSPELEASNLTFRRKDGDGGDESEKEGGNLHHG
jgi:hypothetical protein